MSETVIIILAAGESIRLGQPKQLLRYKGKTLIRHVIDEAMLTERKVGVVIGANDAAIRKELKTLEIDLLFNLEWKTGMASSIKRGVIQYPDAENFILCLCDQPYVSANLFRRLMAKKKAGNKKIVASAYEQTLGTPVLFDNKYFGELRNLKGNEGTKKLLAGHSEEVAQVIFDGGEIDIDNIIDYEKLSDTSYG
jgi:molybdenum cofactor cytidylyltransferase